MKLANDLPALGEEAGVWALRDQISIRYVPARYVLLYLSRLSRRPSKALACRDIVAAEGHEVPVSDVPTFAALHHHWSRLNMCQANWQAQQDRDGLSQRVEARRVQQCVARPYLSNQSMQS